MVLNNKDDLNPEGVESLLAAMITLAIRDIKNSKVGSIGYQNAFDWLTYDCEIDQYGIPFSSVCFSLGLEPSYVRKRIYEIPKIREKLEKQGILETLLKINCNEVPLLV